MRSIFAFLAGCVIGATGILAWVHETRAESLPAAARPVSAPIRIARADARAPMFLGDTALLVPVMGVDAKDLKSDFGDARGGGRAHQAIDIRAPRGTPVVAAADGTVRKLFTSNAGGLTIYQYDTSEERCYYYAHLDRYAPEVREGMTVKRGDVIGYVGTTGNAPPGAPHLHFAITILPPTKEWWKGEPIDPYPFFR